MTEMKHISPLKAGYLVRKVVKGKLKTRFFGANKAGCMEQALRDAQAYRDELVSQSADSVSYQSQNINNNTGYIGVAWHCRPNESRANGVVHFFRAQFPQADSKAKSRSWAVSRFGLLDAYARAVIWRKGNTGDTVPARSELTQKFVKSFLPYYIHCAVNETELEVKNAMIEALRGLCDSAETSEIQRVAREGMRKLTKTRNLMVVSTNRSPQKVKGLLEEARETEGHGVEAV